MLKAFIILVFISYAIIIIAGFHAIYASNRSINQINMAKLIKEHTAVFFISSFFVAIIMAVILVYMYLTFR